MSTQKNTTALFVRIPAEQATALDRAAFALGRAKQEIVSSLLARHVDPDSPASLAALAPPQQRRITIEPLDSSSLVVGHASAIARDEPARAPDGDVLTLDEAAELLRVAPEVVQGMAAEGRLPGRRLGEEWRFARLALLRWLADGDAGSAGAGE